jgi:hypothetical protein
MRDTGNSDDYTRMPTEIAANRAADAFARARYPDDLEALAANDRTRQFVQPRGPIHDLVGATAGMIWNYVDANAVDEQDSLSPSRASLLTTLLTTQPFRRSWRDRNGLDTDGARRARTADLLGAIQALSQLSYSPERGTV